MPKKARSSPSNHRQAVGRWGEQKAADYLTQLGAEILGKNIRTPYGEIDILARLGEDLIFVEVKTRTNQAFGLPETSITALKRDHMIQAAEAYLQEHPELGLAWRIDVIAIQGSKRDPNPEIVHFENAVS